jgi:hypothetical protein
MSYIKHVLQPGETVRYQGRVHWILYVPAIILGVVGAVSSLFGPPVGSYRDLPSCGIDPCAARLVHPLDD